jgi:hypothetical protein
MANERMYLLHTPSGCYAYMAKRMGWGWYDTDDTAKDIEALFSRMGSGEMGSDQDAFVIAFDEDERLITQVSKYGNS